MFKSITSLLLFLAFFMQPGICCISKRSISSAKPGTFRCSNRAPEKHDFFDRNESEIPSRQQQIEWLPHYRGNHCKEILQTSNFPNRTYFSDNGFVNTVVDCYNYHHNLIVTPDDIWVGIMTQFSFYINKHAEEFRGKFVNFEGKKQLTVTVPGSLRSAPYDTLVKLMSDEIHKNLIDAEVKSWIMPNFTTTTENDKVTAGVVFMASMKKYFDYRFSLACGIPEITLEGTKEDWEEIHRRLGKLKEYKLGRWYNMLEPILKEFVAAKDGRPNEDFWQRIAHHERGGSGPSYVSGWITAFCVFDKEGNWQGRKTEGKWLKLETNRIPTGIVEVDVKIDDNGREYDSIMFAGHMGAEVKGDGWTVQPVLGWTIALKPSEAELQILEKENHYGRVNDEDENDY